MAGHQRVSLVLGMLAVLLGTASAGAEAYGWSISASSTDPYANTAEPGATLVNAYLWLICVGSEGIGAAGFRTIESGSFVFASWATYAPTGLQIVDGASGQDHLLFFCGSVTTPLLVGQYWFVDTAGLGGTLCFGDNLYGDNVTADRKGVQHQHAWVGFATDGSEPCFSGQYGPTAAGANVESVSWSRVRSMYR